MSDATALRVLLVEDSALLRQRIIDFVEEPGEVEIIGCAETQDEAVEQLRTQPVDVAVVDLNLREGTGLGVLESVAADHSGSRPMLVVFTNYAFPEFRDACAQRGADYFLDKTSQICELKGLLRSLHDQLH